LERRRLGRARDFGALLRFFRTSVRPMEAKDLPVPPLFLAEIYGVLGELSDQQPRSLVLLQASGEADDLLAEMCRESALGGLHSVIVSQDSDFFFCKGVNFALLHELGVS